MLSNRNLHQFFFALFFIVLVQESKANRAIILVPIFQSVFTDTCFFLDKKLIATDQVSLSEMVIGDIDKNGLKDIAINVFDADKIAWLRNTGGGSYTEELMDDTMDGASCIALADREQDGDLDIYGGAYNIGKMRWWNQLGDGTFSNEHTNYTYPHIEDIAMADIVPFGHGSCQEATKELIIASELEYPLVLTVSPCISEPFTILYAWDNGTSTFTKVRAANINNIDLLDLVGIAPSEGKLLWWETTNRLPADKYIITDDFAGINDFATADLDNDGYQDIVAISATLGHIAIWMNSSTAEFSKVLIEEQFLGAQSVAIKDIDGNGFADIGSSF